MTFPLVLDLAADGVPVAVTCRVLGFSRQAFYAWRHDPVSDRDVDDAYLAQAALKVHADDPGFGYRFVADELKAAGHTVGERRIWRLCSQAGIFSAHSRKDLRRMVLVASGASLSAGPEPPHNPGRFKFVTLVLPVRPPPSATPKPFSVAPRDRGSPSRARL